MNPFKITNELTDEIDEFYYDGNGNIGKIDHVDLSRIALLNQMTRSQKEMFALGLGYFAAYLTDGEVRAGRTNIPEIDIDNLETIRNIMKTHNLKTDLS